MRAKRQPSQQGIAGGISCAHSTRRRIARARPASAARSTRRAPDTGSAIARRRRARVAASAVAQEIGDMKRRQPSLARAETVIRPGRTWLGSRQAISKPCWSRYATPKSRARHVAERRLVQQYAVALARATPDAPAQLMQLRQPQALSVFDNHERGVGHVHADFDDVGGDQQLHLTGLERGPDFPSRRISGTRDQQKF